MRKKTTVRLSEEAERLQAALAVKLGLNFTKVLEQALRKFAEEEGLLGETFDMRPKLLAAIDATRGESTRKDWIELAVWQRLVAIGWTMAPEEPPRGDVAAPMKERTLK
jgi:hypothetical protein